MAATAFTIYAEDVEPIENSVIVTYIFLEYFIIFKKNNKNIHIFVIFMKLNIRRIDLFHII